MKEIGRAIREFIRELVIKCGYIIEWTKISYDEILKASIDAVVDESRQKKLLSKSIKKMIR
ncbi:MAG: hypothetical protein RSD14_03030 [Clostridia bacterium]